MKESNLYKSTSMQGQFIQKKFLLSEQNEHPKKGGVLEAEMRRGTSGSHGNFQRGTFQGIRCEGFRWCLQRWHTPVKPQHSEGRGRRIVSLRPAWAT
jgi:hypothetical protein